MTARAPSADARNAPAEGLVLRTERLVLRPFRESDFDAVHEYASDFETTAYLRWGPNRPEDTRAFLAEVAGGRLAPRQFDFAAAEAAGGRLGGGLRLLERAPRRYELSFVFARRVRGRGYATESVRLLLRFAAADLAAEEVFALVVPDNPASRRVLVRCGFHPAPDPDPYAAWRDGLCSTAEVLRLTPGPRAILPLPATSTGGKGVTGCGEA